MFACFVRDIHYEESSEDMSAYQIPHESLNANILHFLHWPPETPGQPRRWSLFGFSAYSLRMLAASFPDSQTNALFHDYFCKHVLVNRPDGTRKTNSEIYDYHIPKHHRFSRLLFEKSSAELIVVWGGPARRWFKKEFNVEGDEKYGIVHGVVIGEKPAKYLARWADIDVLEEVRDIIETLSIETLSIERDIDVDPDLLEKRLRKREELKDVTMPRASELRKERRGGRTWYRSRGHGAPGGVQTSTRRQDQPNMASNWHTQTNPVQGKVFLPFEAWTSPFLHDCYFDICQRLICSP
ncbi:hypothetical protein LTR49_016036 [Elasticomyces elasticus]|nr:hypothetical protein LTR49_016036 [Elasticomyces elasticus]